MYKGYRYRDCKGVHKDSELLFGRIAFVLAFVFKIESVAARLAFYM